jgi:hypothetical protein
MVDSLDGKDIFEDEDLDPLYGEVDREAEAEEPVAETFIDVADLMGSDSEDVTGFEDDEDGDEESADLAAITAQLELKARKATTSWSETGEATKAILAKLKSGGGIINGGRGEITYAHTPIAEVQQASPELLPTEIVVQIEASVDSALQQWGATPQKPFIME